MRLAGALDHAAVTRRNGNSRSSLFEERRNISVFASIRSDILQPICFAFCILFLSLVPDAASRMSITRPGKNCASWNGKDVFVCANSRLLMRYRKIRHLSTPVAFADLITVDDDVDKTRGGKIFRVFPGDLA